MLLERPRNYRSAALDAHLAGDRLTSMAMNIKARKVMAKVLVDLTIRGAVGRGDTGSRSQRWADELAHDARETSDSLRLTRWDAGRGGGRATTGGAADGAQVRQRPADDASGEKPARSSADGEE